MTRRFRWLAVGATLAALSACSAEPSPTDQAIDYAIEACEMQPDSEGGEYAFAEPDGEWSISDPVVELQELQASIRSVASDASNAAKLDSVWQSLAESTARQASIVNRVLSWREADPYRPTFQMLEEWPSFNDDAAQYNADVDFRATECRALAERLNS
jgi:hypothetical protein